MTTRFTDETWEQHVRWTDQHMKKGCIYPSPRKISPKIPFNTTLYVIEMNNTTNQIMGIGVMANMISKPRTIFSDRNYNRYAYTGPIRIDRSELTHMVTIGDYHVKLIQILEVLCFKGPTHSKRNTGITKLPQAVLNNSYVNFTQTLHDLFEPLL